MKVSLMKFRRAACNFLDILERKGIENVFDLEKMIGLTFSGSKRHHCSVEVRLMPEGPSNFGHYDICYIHPKAGKIFELSINRELDYQHIIIKLQGIASGYSPFFRDDFGNYVQSRILEPSYFSLFLGELSSFQMLGK